MDSDNAFEIVLPLVAGILPAIAVIFAGWYVGIFLHECGHLLAALLIGWEPLSFRVGTGPTAAAFRRGDLHVKLGWWPNGGLVTATTKTASRYRFKWFVFAISGPLVNFAIAWGIWQVLKQVDINSHFSPWTYWLLEIFLATQAVLFFGTICPGTARVYGRKYASDGLQALQSLSMSRKKLARRVAEHRTGRISVYLERGEEERAMKALEEISVEGGWQPLFMRTTWIHWLLAHGKRAQADTAMEALLGEADTLGFPRCEVLDGLACLPLFYGHSHLRGRAMGYIDEAIRENPSMITLKGTKGSLLVEEGKYQEGLAMLQEVMAHTATDDDRAICSYYIALATRETNGLQEGRQLLEKAIKQYPECIARPRVYQLFWNNRA